MLVALLMLPGCSDSPKPQVRITESMPNIPLPPGGQFLSREVGEEAIKLRFRTETEVDRVAGYYRHVLAQPPWDLVHDTPMKDGSIALYAEQKGGPPLWVTIRKAEGAPGSFVDLLGAKTR